MFSGNTPCAQGPDREWWTSWTCCWTPTWRFDFNCIWIFCFSPNILSLFKSLLCINWRAPICSERISFRVYKTDMFYTHLLAGVKLYGGPRASGLLNIGETSSFHHEYSSLACTIEIVDDVFAAIDHIHKHGRYVGFLLPLYIHLYLHYLYFSHFQGWKSFFLSFSAVLILIALSQKILMLLLLSFVKLTGRLRMLKKKKKDSMLVSPA